MPRGFGGRGWGGRGWGGGGFRRGGWGWGGGWGYGGGWGLGGGPLTTGLLAGGLGYLLGSNSANQQPPMQQVPMAYPGYPAYPPPQAAPAQGGDNSVMAQLQLLGQLHANGTLTDDEFAREKQRLLGG